MNAKKIISLLFVFLLSAACISCGANSGTEPNTEPADNTSVTQKSNETADVSTPDQSTAKEYRNDISCELLYKNAENVISLEDASLSFREKGELSLSLEPGMGEIFDAEYASDFAVRFTGGNSFDEFGVLHVTDPSNVETVKQGVQDFLKNKKEDGVYRSYFPDEAYKLDESEVQVFGSYVCYAILSKANRSAFFEQIKQLLEY